MKMRHWISGGLVGLSMVVAGAALADDGMQARKDAARSAAAAENDGMQARKSAARAAAAAANDGIDARKAASRRAKAQLATPVRAEGPDRIDRNVAAPTRARDALESRFEKADLNNDGEISAAEVGRFNWGHLKAADLDGSGGVSVAELRQALGHKAPARR